MPAMIFMILLLMVAVSAALVGAFTLSQATQGVGWIAIACFLGILARMAQADWIAGQASPAKGIAHVPPRSDGPPALYLRGGATPLRAGETLRLAGDLQLFAAADTSAARVGTLGAGRRCTVVSAQPGWIFVQCDDDDGVDEGWVRVL